MEVNGDWRPVCNSGNMHYVSIWFCADMGYDTFLFRKTDTSIITTSSWTYNVHCPWPMTSEHWTEACTHTLGRATGTCGVNGVLYLHCVTNPKCKFLKTTSQVASDI